MKPSPYETLHVYVVQDGRTILFLSSCFVLRFYLMAQHACCSSGHHDYISASRKEKRREVEALSFSDMCNPETVHSTSEYTPRART